MPAGILPFKRELNAFAGVSPRYLEKVHREEKTYVPPPQERYDTQRQWEGVQSRYLTNVSSVEQQKLREDRIIRENNLLADRQDPLGGWEQRDMHREYTKRHGLGAVTSRYEEDAVTKGHPDVTPRDLVRKKDEIEKLEKGWRGTHSLNKHTTFDVLYKKRLKAHPEDDPNNFKKNKARSPVSDYVRHGTPIESVSRNGVPGSGGSLSFVNNNNNNSSSGGGGGARSSSAQIRRSSQSPWQRSSSPETFAYGQWRSGGVTSSSFEALRKQTLKANPHFARGEERAKSVIERQQSTKVDESFVPRVASLALAYQLPGGTARSDSMSQSPYRNGNNNNNSPNRRSATIRNQSPIAHHHNQNNNNNNTNSSIRRANSPSSSSANASRNNSPYRRSTNASNLANKNSSSSYSYQNNNNSSNSKKQQHQQQKQKSYKINDDDDEYDDDKKKKETAEEKELAEERQRQLEDEMLSAEMR